MLVESMNHAEITREVLRDFDKLYATTAQRLGHEYYKERIKFKIDPKKTYPKVFPVKTAAKNPWLLFFGKAPADEKYKDQYSAHISFVTYYYNSKGLQVIDRANGGFIEIYNGHFFKRYNERMNLNLDDPLEIIKTYFMYGGNAAYSIVKKENRQYTIGVCSEGFLLGELYHNQEWLVNRTFISRDLARPDQDKVESELIASLKRDILRAMLLRGS